jgi:hypothetical protein
MTKQTRSNLPEKPVESFLPLTPAVFHILLNARDGEAHGYAMMQEVARRSGGTVRLGPGTLYGAVVAYSRMELSRNRKSARIRKWMTRGVATTGSPNSAAAWLAAETERLRNWSKPRGPTKAVRKLKPA